jgi:nitrite reductase (cytochrome c-552)
MANVYERQGKVEELRRIAEKNLARVHIEAKTAWDNGATEEEMKPVLQLIRHAQWRWDWVAAANGLGFHAPVEALRVLGTSIQKVQEARILLTEIFVRKGVKTPIELPDISTKAKAQEYIGLEMPELLRKKSEFLTTVVPEWTKKAAVRESKLNN